MTATVSSSFSSVIYGYSLSHQFTLHSIRQKACASSRNCLCSYRVLVRQAAFHNRRRGECCQQRRLLQNAQTIEAAVHTIVGMQVLVFWMALTLCPRLLVFHPRRWWWVGRWGRASCWCWPSLLLPVSKWFKRWQLTMQPAWCSLRIYTYLYRLNVNWAEIECWAYTYITARGPATYLTSHSMIVKRVPLYPPPKSMIDEYVRGENHQQHFRPRSFDTPSKITKPFSKKASRWNSCKRRSQDSQYITSSRKNITRQQPCSAVQLESGTILNYAGMQQTERVQSVQEGFFLIVVQMYVLVCLPHHCWKHEAERMSTNTSNQWYQLHQPMSNRPHDSEMYNWKHIMMVQSGWCMSVWGPSFVEMSIHYT